MTATNMLGISGARDYGIDVHPATFDPACDAYAVAPEPAEKGTTYYNAKAKDSSVRAIFKPTKSSEQTKGLPMSFFKSAVNQPSFANGTWCNKQERLFSTTLSTGANSPKAVSGTVNLDLVPLFTQKKMEWTNTIGVQVDTAFIEHHLVSCETFRGFKYKEETTQSAFAPVLEIVSDLWNGNFPPSVLQTLLH